MTRSAARLMKPLSTGRLFAYGLFGLPLAMAALPLYVHLPKFYGDELGLNLALVGLILLLARLVDALQDPLLGYWSDRAPGRKRFVAMSLPLLTLGMLGLFNPPALSAHSLGWWLLGCLVVVYLGFSMASISYQAWGAQLSAERNERTRITASRETFTLLGVVTAAALPALLGAGGAEQLSRFALVFVLLLLVCALLTLLFSPSEPLFLPGQRSSQQSSQEGVFRALLRPLSNKVFRKLLVVFVLNGIASAIPATLVMFFMADVLQLGEQGGWFLALYFISGALGMPLWVFVSRRFGKQRAWLAGMGLSVAAFVWAYGLGAGDVPAFAIVCVLSGVALGADLALPPSLLADAMDEHVPGGDDGAPGVGAYFGLWNLVTKLNLALAAGISLPLLAALGYVPGTPGGAAALSMAYCLIPCALKLLAMAALWRWSVLSMSKPGA